MGVERDDIMIPAQIVGWVDIKVQFFVFLIHIGPQCVVNFCRGLLNRLDGVFGIAEPIVGVNVVKVVVRCGQILGVDVIGVVGSYVEVVGVLGKVM